MFNYKASIQSIDYIINKLSVENPSLDKMTILKIIFFAERYSLRKFGQSITNDKFVAMKFGPVASKTYDILKFVDYVKGIDYAREILEKDGSCNVKSKKTFLDIEDYDELSVSDIESIDFAINSFGKYSSIGLSKITHEYLEWYRFEQEIEKTNSSFPMNIDDFFEPTNEQTKQFSIISDDLVRCNKELYNESIFDR